MKKYNIIWILTEILILTTLFGCEKDYQLYNANLHAVRFTISPDSMVYSFSFYPGKESDTISLPIQILGFSEERDRIVNVIADPEKTTAVADEDYVLLPTLIPAKQVSDSVRVILKKSEKLENQNICLALRIVDSDDLEAGPTNSYRIYFTSQLVKPQNWPSQFGEYSVVKHRFCIEVLGVGDYCTYFDFQLVTYYLRQLTEALYKYNNEHPNDPLKDENGKIITFY